VSSTPYVIELLGQRVKQSGIVGQHTDLEVATALPFRAHPGSGQVRTAEISPRSVHYHAFEVNPRAENSLNTFPQLGKTVEVLSERRPRLLCMNQTNFHTSFKQFRENQQEGNHCLLTGLFHIHILDVGCSDPQPIPGRRNQAENHIFVYHSVGKKSCFGHETSPVDFVLQQNEAENVPTWELNRRAVQIRFSAYSIQSVFESYKQKSSESDHPAPLNFRRSISDSLRLICLLLVIF
jgi:hypothetical protein